MVASVLALNASPRHGNTRRLVGDIASWLEAHEVRVSVLDLADYRVDDCAGCQTCILKGRPCPQKDDSAAILARILEADGLVLASPVYMMNVPGQLKSLFDKTAIWFHRPPLAGRPALLAATTAAAGLDDTLNYMRRVVIQWGMQPVGFLGRKLGQDGPIDERPLRSFLWHIRSPRVAYRPSLAQLLQYQVQKVLALKVLPLDREYWLAQGWERRPFYYDCRISPPKRLLAAGFYHLLSHRVRSLQPVS